MYQRRRGSNPIHYPQNKISLCHSVGIFCAALYRFLSFRRKPMTQKIPTEGQKAVQKIPTEGQKAAQKIPTEGQKKRI